LIRLAPGSRQHIQYFMLTFIEQTADLVTVKSRGFEKSIYARQPETDI